MHGSPVEFLNVVSFYKLVSRNGLFLLISIVFSDFANEEKAILMTALLISLGMLKI